MYINKVKIKNFRNFSEFEVDLNEGLSIIIGENNCGKSNFLEALNLIFNSNYSLRKRVLEQEDFWNGIIIEKEWPEITIEVLLKGIDTDNELAVTSKWLTRNPGEARLTYKFRPRIGIKAKVPLRTISINKIRIPLEEYEWVIYGGEKETLDVFDFNMLNKFEVEYVGALRDATSNLKKSSGLLYRVLKQFDLSEEEIDNLSKDLDKLNNKIEKGKEIIEVQDLINSFLSKITGVSKQQVQIKMGESDYDTILKELKLSIGLEEEQLHSVEKNGLGYNNLLYISLLLSQYTTAKQKKIKNHDYLFPLLIVEEPEAHLHSNLQKVLADYFFNNDVVGQVIMTTHSSHVSSHGKLENLIVFYKKAEKLLSKRIGTIFDETVKKQKEYKKYLERWLDATKSNIFFGQKVLLVEGIAERLLIPKFFRMKYIGKSLESENISLISVDGVAFRPFLHLFNPAALNMKCAVLTDSDPAKVPAVDEDDLPIKNKAGELIMEPVYPDKKENCDVCDRTNSLIRDFSGFQNIEIFNNLKTFEYDLMMAQNTSFFKSLIIENSIGTKSDRENIASLEGREFAKVAYGIISSEKGDFSQLILNELEKGKENEFNIPLYIEEAFEFLLKKEGEYNVHR